MEEESEYLPANFLSAEELLKARGIKVTAWDDYQKSEMALPKTGKKHFEPNGTWLQEKQLENGLKTRKKLLEIERVDRASQLASAEWLLESQKAKVTKFHGKMWDTFGHYEQSQMYLTPEEALFLLETNAIELICNDMPLSIQQAYEIVISSKASKCTMEEYRVYSHLVKNGFKVKRFQEKPMNLDNNKTVIATKKIVMNDNGFWTSDEGSENKEKNGVFWSSSLKNDGVQMEIKSAEQKPTSNVQKSPKPLKVSEQKIVKNIKIIKSSNNLESTSFSKWPGVKANSTNNDKVFECTDQKENLAEKRSASSSLETNPPKKFKPEVIDISDDEIVEIPVPMTKTDILNTLPNIRPYESTTIRVSTTHLPPNIRPSKSVYEFNGQRLSEPSCSNLPPKQTQTNYYNHMTQYRNNNFSSSRNGHVSGSSNHFYAQRSHAVAYSSNNGFSYRNQVCRWQQNTYHNSMHNSVTGTYCSNMNYVMSVMSNKLNNSRFTQQVQTTYCQNFEFFQIPRFNAYGLTSHPYQSTHYHRDAANWRRVGSSYYRSRGGGVNRYPQLCDSREDNFPSFTVPQNVNSWSDVKQKWNEDTTIVIEDEDTDCDVQVVEDKITPIINTSTKIANISDVYERLKIIKSAPERTVRSRRLSCYLSYEIHSTSQTFKRSESMMPSFRIYVVNILKEAGFDFVKLQKLKQDSGDVPIVIACVTESSISYVKLDVVRLPNLQ